MNNNYDLQERNEINQNSKGGTEITFSQVYDGTISRELLEEFQIVPSRIRGLKEDKIRIFFANDLPNDPESIKLKDTSLRGKFHKLIFNSNWQYIQYQMVLGIPYDTNSFVIEPGIVPAPPECLEKAEGTIHIAYTSTPQRGLDILIPVFKKLAEEDKDIHLHIHSSFKIYGWDEMDQKHQTLYDSCNDHPQITYHGYTPHEELLEKLNNYHILSYPSTWIETSCRAMLESMSAGMLCVHPNYGALPETSGSLNMMYQGDQDKAKHAAIFHHYLKAAIATIRENSESLKLARRFTKSYVDGRYGIKNIQKKWELVLEDLLRQYPTIESRKFAKQIGFSYNSMNAFRR